MLNMLNIFIHEGVRLGPSLKVVITSEFLLELILRLGVFYWYYTIVCFAIWWSAVLSLPTGSVTHLVRTLFSQSIYRLRAVLHIPCVHCSPRAYRDCITASSVTHPVRTLFSQSIYRLHHCRQCYTSRAYIVLPKHIQTASSVTHPVRTLFSQSIYRLRVVLHIPCAHCSPRA